MVGSRVPEGCHEKQYIFFIALLNQCYWIVGSLIGSWIGTVITINTKGLDFAMTALFIVIVLEQFLTSKKHIYTYIGFVISLICLIVFKSQSFIIPSLVGIVLSLLMKYKVGEYDA